MAWGQPLALFVILAVAIALRLYGVDWDQNSYFHPDERSVYMRVDCMYRLLTKGPGYQDCLQDTPFRQVQPGIPSPTVFLDASKSPLNPHWFPLGSMILYWLVLIKLLLAPVLTMGMNDLATVGRTLSALADVGTVAMVYFLGKRLYGRGAGLLAAVFVTFAAIDIQHSHYYRPEPFTNLFTLAAFWSMLNVVERRQLRDSVFLGIFIGLAFATKVSVLPLLLPVAVVYIYLFYRIRKDVAAEHRAEQREKVLVRLLAAGAVALAGYLFWTPYAFLDFPEFLRWNLSELDIVRHAGSVPYTVQYIGTPKFVYELQQTIAWSLGIPLGLLAWGGLLATIVLNVWRPRMGQVLLLLWAVPLLLTVGNMEVKFVRYVFPLMPVLILMGSGVAWKVVAWLRRHVAVVGIAAAGVLGIAVAATVFYALAFEYVYAKPHTAVQASRWINANVSPGVGILTDNHWDEGIPNLGRYRVSQLPMFEGDTRAKMDNVASLLAGADYLVFYSNRTYGAIARVPDRFPLSSGYYKMLFSGDLGYEMVSSFDAYPRLLGVAFVDDPFSRAGLTPPAPLQDRSVAPVTLDLGYADNDVITYDHPLVMVFKNTEKLDRSRLLTLLLGSGTAQAAQPPVPLMLTPEERVIQEEGGTWTDLFNINGLANRFPLVAWLLLVEAASLAVLPLGFLVFRGLHDRGYLLAKTLAMLLLAYFPWLLAALKLVSFERASIYLVLLALALLSALVLAVQRRQVAALVRTHWRVLLLEEVLFLTAFLAFVAIRWANPDLWHPFRGGEKPMDFAYLNAIVKSTTIPPYDPWFAGGYLNYYYFGQFIVATLIKATGVLPEVAYNLAVPLLFALAVGGAFSVVYNLTHALRRRAGLWRSPAWGPAAAGVAAALIVAVAGNLGGAVQLLKAAWDHVASGVPFPAFDFWASSRMMPGQISITEFPFWTFLFADLHAHLIAIPFALLAIGLALNLVLVADAWRRGWAKTVLPVTVLALAVGALAAINTWDYPTYLALAVAAVGLAAYAARGRLDGCFLAMAAVGTVVVAALSYLAFLPFHERNVDFNAGVHASVQKTNVIHYLGIHGLFLFLVLSYLAVELWRYIRTSMFTPKRAGGELAEDVSPGRRVARVFLLLLVAAIAVVAYLVAADYYTVALLFLLAVLVAFLVARRLAMPSPEAPYHLFLLLLLLGAMALGIVVDLLTLNNDIDRMNTVFKLYLQAWVLYGLAAATILWHLAATGLFPLRRLVWPKAVWLGVLLVLVAAIAVFPLLGTRARLADRFSTDFRGLNGAQYVATTVYHDAKGPIDLSWDWEAIQWLRENVKGSPVVAEGNTAPDNYRWGSRVSIYTGLPTIIGWGWHQTQQRAVEQGLVSQRIADVAILYSTTDVTQKLRILRQHNVKYIYVGDLERLYYSQQGLDKFQGMSDMGVKLVHSNSHVAIYQFTEPR